MLILEILRGKKMPFVGAVVSSDGVVRSTLPDVTVPEQDLSTFVWSKAADYAKQPALVLFKLN